MMLLARAREACQAALNAPEICAVTDALAGRVQPRAELEKVTVEPRSTEDLTALAAKYAVDSTSLTRWLLLNTVLETIAQIPPWPVAESVKRLWAEDAIFYAKPTGNLSVFSPQNVRFREMARIATLRRYPAGQFHWEIAGFPRSLAFRTPIVLWPKLFWTIGAKMGGFAPVAETHLNDRRNNRLTLTESEGVLSYYRLARSMELQPEIKGLFTCSWLYCPTTANVSPRLAWMREFFAELGAFIGSVGPAPSDSGFLVGSEVRRKLFEKGDYRPQMTYILWPRGDMLEWARRHQELDE